jgi:hypothetical protein
MSASLSLSEPFQPSDAEVILAREAGRALANLAGQDRAVRVEATETAAPKASSYRRPRCGCWWICWPRLQPATPYPLFPFMPS